jgi:S1-C subfamily serine protease
MTTTTNADPLTLLSGQLAALVERAATGIVAVHCGRRHSISGIHWRPGVLVTAEEALDRDEDIALLLPDGRKIAATLAGRDPSTDVAVLRFEPGGLPLAATGDATTLRAGHFVLAVGRYDGGPLASQGIVAYAGGAWQSQRGGTIDQFLRLDLGLSPAAEGGALVDVGGKALGMTVLGPRRRALAIPAATIDRAVDQLLAKGHVARGYLGAALQRVRLGGDAKGLLVIGVDANGPAAQAGMLVGDIITAWNGAPTTRVREIWRLLGTDSVGTSVELKVLRAGNPVTVPIALGERPLD